MMNEERWFSYPIWWTMAEYEHHQELLEYCLLRKAYDDGNLKSNIGGWQSSDIYSDSDRTIGKFCAFLQPYLNTLNEKIKIKLIIDNFWININGFGTTNDLHTHPRSYISGVFYVKAEENQGNICFENPLRHFNQFMYGDSIFLDPIVYHTPETSKLLLFPSFLPHSVLTNKTNIDRISIAFNTKIVNE